MCIEGPGGGAVGENDVRTNVVLDRDLVARGLEATGLRTRRELIDHALRELLRHRDQRRILELKGRIEWHGDLEEMRRDRNP